MLTGEKIAKILGGRKTGRGWVARCPAHNDRRPSLSICDSEIGRVLVRCHAGCGQESVIAALRSRGLWEDYGDRDTSSISRPKDIVASDRSEREKRKRTKAALRLWHAGVDAAGSLVVTYLESRGLHLPQSAAIRFHPALKHPAGETWPALVALVTTGQDNMPKAIHRTFLARDGTGKAPVTPAKMMLGSVKGGAVRLSNGVGPLVIAEGIETALSLVDGLAHVDPRIWAALSTSGVAGLDLPAPAGDLVIAPDGDAPGLNAAEALGRRGYARGWNVRILPAPREGSDWNDYVRERGHGSA